MAYLIYEDGDYTGVRCSDCHKLLVSFYSPFHGDLEISADDLFKIRQHSQQCSKQSVILEKCKKGDHELEAISVTAQSASDEVVTRWCKKCGAVVVDRDVNGATQRGQVMAMKEPLLARVISKGEGA